jgi:hypothetical protein
MDRQILHKEQRQEITNPIGRPNRNVADTERSGLEGQESEGQLRQHNGLSAQCNQWDENWLEAATRFCRVDDGVSDRIQRLKALGNAIVPQCAMVIMQAIKDMAEVPDDVVRKE